MAAIVGISPAQTLSASHSGSRSGTVPQGTLLVAELAKSIDAKKSKSGDVIKAKVVQDVLANGQILIHRGSRLVGHIVQAKAFNQADSQSVLGVVFDAVDLKHGEEMNLNAVLQALAPPVPESDPLNSSDYDGNKGLGSQPVSGRSRPWVTEPRDRIDHTREDALRNASDPGSYGGAANTLHQGLLGSGNRGVFGMPGVTLKSSATPELVSTKADIKLESGTQMVLEVMASR